MRVLASVAFVTYKEWAAYRSHMAMSIIVGSLLFLVQVFIWTSVYGDKAALHGLSLHEMITYHGIVGESLAITLKNPTDLIHLRVKLTGHDSSIKETNEAATNNVGSLVRLEGRSAFTIRSGYLFSINELVPKDKFDEEALIKLKAIDPVEINLKPIIGDLFEWIQDINWPIAKELCIVLAGFRPEDIIPQIRMILHSGDDCWQYSCILFLIPHLSTEVKNEITPDLLRIIMTPTKNEKLCEIDARAREIFEGFIEKLS
ncbi:DUF5071 domain-containing protein [Paenibacillus gansuensis]|uniref:DUF5071 domain-containing protein n=1 Tax=Paenibacillus gansuensis TaxID=306542 RepID=A0ABW5P9C4_9BACL